MSIQIINTKPFTDQQSGTSGLRKKVKIFQSENYIENYIQSIFDTDNSLRNGILIIGGDGRFFNQIAIQKILKIAAANKIKKCYVGQDGILSTPAASNLIKKYHANGGIILTASHNPGGEEGDFGIKLNGSNGSPVSEKENSDIFKQAKKISAYKILSSNDIDLSKISKIFLDQMEIEIIDSVKDYIELLEKIFNFEEISKLFRNGFKMKFDSMNAVTGPYAKKIFEEKLGAEKNTVINCIPLENFGGTSPDPNPENIEKQFTKSEIQNLDFIAQSDGDGDRNLIMGKGVFISPSDSLAVIVANADLIPFYSKRIVGAARSLPTSKALNKVTEKLGIKCYETPTGWKFFGNLLENNLIDFCGEESFGTGSNHVGEKDGLWAVLAWVNLLAKTNMSVPDIIRRHWSQFGRHYFLRCDYNISSDIDATRLMINLTDKIKNLSDEEMLHEGLIDASEFIYTDPVDGTTHRSNAIQLNFNDESRIIIRQSGTGTEGSTLRIYLEKFESNQEMHNLNRDEIFSDLINFAEKFSCVYQYTKKNNPDSII